MRLFKPAWKGYNKAKALKVVEKETNQSKLAEIAQNAPLREVCSAAVDKLTSQNLLAEIVLNKAGFNNVAVEAARKVTDQRFLVEIAKKCENTAALIVAVEKLTDQETLADIAQVNDGTIGAAALANLSDQTLARKIFADIVRKSKKSDNGSTRMEMAKRLTDQDLLTELAQKDIDWQIRVAAVERLMDQKTLAHLAKYDSITEVRTAALKKMTDRTLAQELLNEIEQNNKVYHSGPQFVSYGDFFNAVRQFINKREYDRAQAAIESLTDQNILSEIENGSENDWCIDRGIDNYGPYHIVDLRETAGRRLVQLKKLNIKPDAIKGKFRESEIEISPVNYDVNEKPDTDLFVMIKSLENAPKERIKGLINGVVVMTPEFTMKLQQLPHNAKCLYQLQNLNSLPGLDSLDLILRDTQLPANTSYYGPVVLYHGFPSICLKCRKPVKKFELLMNTDHNAEVKMNRVVIDADNAQEIFDVLKNIRRFIAVPCCEEHSLVDHFFIGTGMLPIFTDDKDIADTCMIYSSKPYSSILPVRVVNGEVMMDS